MQTNVRYGSLADIGERIMHVRFTPESGHAQRHHRRLLSARSGHAALDAKTLKAHGYTADQSIFRFRLLAI